MKKIKVKISISLIIILTSLFYVKCTTPDSGENIEKKILNNSKIEEAVKLSESNSNQILSAIQKCEPSYKEGLYFLIENMPERDLKNLSSEYILTNIEYAYKVIDSVKWKDEIPKEIFLNYILPYSNINERRDNWRKDFYNRFFSMVKNSKTISEAVLKLNKEIWDLVNVHYSTKRPKADQSPYESIDAGIASCTGLSILLIDVCRAVGIPARFVGVPLWKDQSGNHSWVEIWDNGWHFIGAAEESPLDETWFGERALTSDDTDWKYSIYAASFKKTDVIFPPLFDSTATYIYADIVTDRYSKTVAEDGKVTLAIRLFDKPNGKRISGNIKVQLKNETVFEGTTKDELHDFNDFLTFSLLPNTQYKIIAEINGESVEKKIMLDGSKYQFVNLSFNN